MDLEMRDNIPLGCRSPYPKRILYTSPPTVPLDHVMLEFLFYKNIIIETARTKNGLPL